MLKHLPFAALSLLGCAHSTTTQPSTDDASRMHYEVTIFDNLGGAEVRFCAEGDPVRELVPMYRSAVRGLTRAWSDAGEIAVREGRIALPQGSSPRCVYYQTRFSGEMFRSRDERTVIVSQAQWLWKPSPFPTEPPATLSFVLPPGYEASVPFPREGDAYVLPRSAFRQDGYSAFGEFPLLRFDVGETSATAARLGPEPDAEVVERWLTTAIRTAGSVQRGLPVGQIQFVVAPTPTDRPVAFGMVRRGGGASVLLLPSPTAEASDLETDWVAIHELSHFWLPRLPMEDRWLTEGIATYLQEVLRARCGLQSPDTSWEHIRAGMSRGSRSGTSRSLARESREMNRTGAYHRVYWTGTAFALEVDATLREKSGGDMTLLKALALTRSAGESSKGVTNSSAFLKALEDVTGTDFLVDLGDRYAKSDEFPETPWVDDEAHQGLREAIMRAEPDACSVSVEVSR